jgi:hypothetical protein
MLSGQGRLSAALTLQDMIDIRRTHPMIIIGGILQQNPFFVPPDEFLREFRQRRAARGSSPTMA